MTIKDILAFHGEKNRERDQDLLDQLQLAPHGKYEFHRFTLINDGRPAMRSVLLEMTNRPQQNDGRRHASRKGQLELVPTGEQLHRLTGCTDRSRIDLTTVDPDLVEEVRTLIEHGSRLVEFMHSLHLSVYPEQVLEPDEALKHEWIQCLAESVRHEISQQERRVIDLLRQPVAFKNSMKLELDGKRLRKMLHAHHSGEHVTQPDMKQHFGLLATQGVGAETQDLGILMGDARQIVLVPFDLAEHLRDTYISALRYGFHQSWLQLAPYGET